jgi:hypothetical protein
MQEILNHRCMKQGDAFSLKIIKELKFLFNDPTELITQKNLATLKILFYQPPLNKNKIPST